MTIPSSTEPPLRLHLFGSFEAHGRGVPLPRLRTRKGQWLLALLALRQGREVERDWLAGTLWPESDSPRGAHNLNMCLTDLRRALGPEAGRLVSPTRRTLRLELSGAMIDALAFDAAIARGDAASLEEAVALYRGPLLEGCVEEWAFPERQAREQAFLEALERLAVVALAAEELSLGERHLRRAAAVDPLRESTQRALMTVLAAAGNDASALQCYWELRERLHRELNTEPDPETQALFQRLRAGARDRPPRAGAPGDGERPGIHVPLQLTSFVGREVEIAQLREQLSARRLVTLTGAGGCGKTRLAIQVASSGLASCTDGVRWLPLAPLADPALVPQTVAAALGISEQPERPLIRTLVHALRPRKLLLLLDNCEHLVAACAQLAETLLQSCPRLRILATSREPLGCEGEWVFRVPPLSVPPAWDVKALGTAPSASNTLALQRLNALPEYEAVRLFIERATVTQPAFSVTDANAGPVAEICRRLDGIPLAIELAAARLTALPLDAIHQRLDDMFSLLTGGRRTALPQHQTLRATVEWSYDLLTPPEQALLRRLSVFAGGCTLDAAEAVCSAVDRGQWLVVSSDNGSDSDQGVSVGVGLTANHDPPSTEFPDLLTRLVEKSLVLYEAGAGGAEGASWGPDPGRFGDEADSAGRVPAQRVAAPGGGEARYRLLEMIREYGREQLRVCGEAEALRERHARFFLGLAETARHGLAQDRPIVWLDRLEREHDNLRAALAWATESSEFDLGMRLACALEGFWSLRGHLREGRDCLLRLLAQPGAAGSSVTRVRTLSSASRFAGLLGDFELKRRLGEECLTMARAVGDREGIAAALLARINGWDPRAVRPLVEEALAIRRELGDPRGIADALSAMAWVHRMEGDLAAERRVAVENLAICRSLGDQVRTSRALRNLAYLLSFRGNQDAAEPLTREALAIARELGDRVGIAQGIMDLGYIAHWREDYPAARALFEQCLPLWRELDHQNGRQESLFHLGFIYQQLGDYPAATAQFEEMLARAREAKDDDVVAAGLALLGDIACDLGRWEEAAAHCAESLTHPNPRERTDRHHIALALTPMARVALTRGRPDRAARLLGAVPALIAATCAPKWPNVRAGFERIVATTCTQLGEAAFAAAWTEGEAMPVEAAIAEALQEAAIG